MDENEKKIASKSDQSGPDLTRFVGQRHDTKRMPKFDHIIACSSLKKSAFYQKHMTQFANQRSMCKYYWKKSYKTARQNKQPAKHWYLHVLGWLAALHVVLLSFCVSVNIFNFIRHLRSNNNNTCTSFACLNCWYTVMLTFWVFDLKNFQILCRFAIIACTSNKFLV